MPSLRTSGVPEYPAMTCGRRFRLPAPTLISFRRLAIPDAFFARRSLLARRACSFAAASGAAMPFPARSKSMKSMSRRAWAAAWQKIFAREGDTLKAGDVIVQLDAAELPAQRDLAAGPGRCRRARRRSAGSAAAVHARRRQAAAGSAAQQHRLAERSGARASVANAQEKSRRRRADARRPGARPTSRRSRRS